MNTYNTEIKICEKCKGAGTITEREGYPQSFPVGRQCPRCEGSGRVKVTTTTQEEPYRGQVNE
jgi:DnaJ-class molecular chaperone